MVSKFSEIWSGLFIPDPDPEFLPTPDPGVKNGIGSRIRIRNTAWNLWCWRRGRPRWRPHWSPWAAGCPPSPAPSSKTGFSTLGKHDQDTKNNLEQIQIQTPPIRHLKSWKALTKRAESRSEWQWYESADLDPYQDVTDPQHRYIYWHCCGSGSEDPDPTPDPYVLEPPGSGSISQGHESADPDLNPRQTLFTGYTMVIRYLHVELAGCDSVHLQGNLHLLHLSGGHHLPVPSHMIHKHNWGSLL